MNFALMSAIALTSAVGFTACSSSDDVTQDTNPTYDGSSVRTDFAFNIATGTMGTTRMGAGVTQQSGNFNGMKDMYLLPFNVVPANGKTTNVTINNYSLGTLTGITADASSKVYSLQIPVGTTDFLFYAKSDPTVTTTTELPENTRKGILSSTLSSELNSTDAITFSLTKILTGSTLGEDATKMAAYLSYIAQAQITTTGDSPETINWYDAPTKAQTIGQYSTLGTMYTQFTTIGDNTARAGSAQGVLRTVFDLYVTAKAIVAAAPGDADVLALANEICKRIKEGVKTTGESSTSDGCFIKIDETNTDPAAWTAVWAETTDNAAYTPNAKFPHNLFLPMGAAQLAYTESTHTFTYKDPAYYELHPTSTPSITGTDVALAKICYPAELVYFDNSPLRATNSYKKVSDYPQTVAAWDNAYANPTSGDWTGQRVEPSTRAVAMQNNVNYGVAMLKTTVVVEDGDGTAAGIQLYDNQKALAGGTNDKTVTLNSTANTLNVSGILIGGQPAKVGWDMTNPGLQNIPANSEVREVFDNVIYDQDITFAANPLGTGVTAPNYTLVLDNYTSGSSQKPVRFALEVVNNSGVDFYGLDGLIPAGHTFYLCGELNPNATTGVTDYIKATRSASYRITAEDTRRVFMQDYQTTANITIKKDALKKAYCTIPDLRATEVLFGLSVDLTWETGMSFNVNIE